RRRNVVSHLCEARAPFARRHDGNARRTLNSVWSRTEPLLHGAGARCTDSDRGGPSMKRFAIPSLLLLLAAVPARAQPRAGREFQANPYITGSQSSPSVALLPSGAFVVVWEDVDSSGDTLGGIKARRFDPSGAPLGAAFAVNTITTGPQFQPSVY